MRSNSMSNLKTLVLRLVGIKLAEALFRSEEGAKGSRPKTGQNKPANLTNRHANTHRQRKMMRSILLTFHIVPKAS